MRKSKLVLGTVQFGMNYGIASASRPDISTIEKILRLAYTNGINILDTSAAYGNAEEILGEVINASKYNFKIISKYPQNDSSVKETFCNTLERLQVSSLYGYLLHHFEVYRRNPQIWEEFEILKIQGKVQKIGFSIYSPDELELLISRNVNFDLIQFPYNIFDRQFEVWLDLLNRRGVEVHTRSVFLQGLFFKDINTLENKLQPLKTHLEHLHGYCEDKHIKIEQLVLNFVVSKPEISGILIGVDNEEQLLNNIKALQKKAKIEDIDFINSIRIKEKDLLNPANWK